MRDGRIVQLGTPEDLVGSPADEYVANFVRDIPRSHVLTLRWIMREPRTGEEDGPRLDVTTTVRNAVPVIAASERPCCAVDGGRIVGVVDKDAVLHGDRRRGARPVAASTIAATPAIVLDHRPWWRSRTTIVAAIVGAMVICHLTLSRTLSWPDSLVWHSLTHYLDNIQNWLAAESDKTHPNFAYRVIHWISSGLDALVRWLYHLLSSWLTWPGTTVLGGLLALRFGGRRAAAIMVASFASFAALGLWDESMQTLALMLVAVALSLLVGVPLGVVAGRSDRFNRLITPVLDAMQIIPAFAYLMPVVIFFSVGPAAAVITTMVYSVPPAVRITALGIRSVPANTVEAATALGSTERQVLWKVQLPLARRLLLLSVNQTILFALSMVVIAGLINTEGGLGAPVTNGLNSNPALAILAGVAIVVMAIALDRVTEAIAERTDPAKRHLDAAGQKRARLATGARARSVAVVAMLGHVALRRLRVLALDGAGLAARPRPERPRLRPEADDVPLQRHHEPGRHLPGRAHAAAARHLPRRDAVVRDARRAHARSRSCSAACGPR